MITRRGFHAAKRVRAMSTRISVLALILGLLGMASHHPATAEAATPGAKPKAVKKAPPVPGAKKAPAIPGVKTAPVGSPPAKAAPKAVKKAPAAVPRVKAIPTAAMVPALPRPVPPPSAGAVPAPPAGAGPPPKRGAPAVAPGPGGAGFPPPVGRPVPAPKRPVVPPPGAGRATGRGGPGGPVKPPPRTGGGADPSCPPGNLIRHARLHGKNRVQGVPAAAVDGQFLPDGQPWDAPNTVRFSDSGFSFAAFDMGRPVKLGWIVVQADHNDTYQVEASLDGKKWRRLWLVPKVKHDGLRTRTGQISGTARYVRIGAPSGDNKLAVSELQVYCQKPNPWPPRTSTPPPPHPPHAAPRGAPPHGAAPHGAPPHPPGHPPQHPGRAKGKGGKLWWLGLFWVPILLGAGWYHYRTPLPSFPKEK